MAGTNNKGWQIPGYIAQIVHGNTSPERRLSGNKNEALESMRSIRERENVALSLRQCDHDKGGRRTGIERRQFSYSLYIPERRSGLERRTNQDRLAPPIGTVRVDDAVLSKELL